MQREWNEVMTFGSKKPTSKNPGLAMGKESNDIKAMVHLESLVEKGEIKFGRNQMGQESVRWCLADGTPIELRIDSDEFRNALSSRLWADCQIILTDYEIKRIKRIFKGLFINKKIGFVEPDLELDFLEKNPFLALVVDFIDAKGRYEATASELHRALKKFALDAGASNASLWYFPKGPNILSRKIRSSKDVLRSLKISIEIWRSNGCKIAMARIPDDVDGQPSSQSSHQNPVNQGVSGADDTSADLEALRARKKSGS